MSLPFLNQRIFVSAVVAESEVPDKRGEERDLAEVIEFAKEKAAVIQDHVEEKAVIVKEAVEEKVEEARGFFSGLFDTIKEKLRIKRSLRRVKNKKGAKKPRRRPSPKKKLVKKINTVQDLIQGLKFKLTHGKKG